MVVYVNEKIEQTKGFSSWKQSFDVIHVYHIVLFLFLSQLEITFDLFYHHSTSVCQVSMPAVSQHLQLIFALY